MKKLCFIFHPQIAFVAKRHEFSLILFNLKNLYLVIILYLETKPKCLAYEDLKWHCTGKAD